MQNQRLDALFSKFKATEILGRYITLNHVEPLIKKLSNNFSVSIVGKSVLKKPIYKISFGKGSKRILLWSQMHGNESTTTKALFDIFNVLAEPDHEASKLLETCTFTVIPILNPDGAEAYTRFNANEIDLNRDAQDLTQPESRALREVFNQFKPHYCFNLHGQRTIFSAGETSYSATLSFLAPSQDTYCTVTKNRKVAMDIIQRVHAELSKEIPNQIAIYDDAFNINCVGDTFQNENVPTILFEAGHIDKDYQREQTRALIFKALWLAFNSIAEVQNLGENYKPYLAIPENRKLFKDIILRNVAVEGEIVDVAIQYSEVLINDEIQFLPIIESIEPKVALYGHREIDFENTSLITTSELKVGNEIVLVAKNDEKLSLKP